MAVNIKKDHLTVARKGGITFTQTDLVFLETVNV